MSEQTNRNRAGNSPNSVGSVGTRADLLIKLIAALFPSFGPNLNANLSNPCLGFFGDVHIKYNRDHGFWTPGGEYDRRGDLRRFHPADSRWR